MLVMHRSILGAAAALAFGSSVLSTSAFAFPGFPHPHGGGLPHPAGGGFRGGPLHFAGGRALGRGPLGGGALGHHLFAGRAPGRGALAGVLRDGGLRGGRVRVAAGRFGPRFAGAARGVGNGSGNSFRGNVYNGNVAAYGGGGGYAAGAYAAGAATGAAAGYGASSVYAPAYGVYAAGDGGCYSTSRTYHTSTGWHTRRVYVCG